MSSVTRSGIGRMPDQRGLGLGKPCGHGRAGTDGERRLADDAVFYDKTGGGHRDRDDKVGARTEFQEMALARRCPGGNVDGGHHLVLFSSRLARTGQKVRQSQPAFALRPGQHNLGIQRQQGRHAIGCGRGVAQVAAQGAPVLDLTRADLARGQFQPVESRGQVGVADIAPGRCSADGHAVGILPDPAQPLDARDVQHRPRQHLALGRGEKIGTACRYGDASLPQKRQRLVQGSGLMVGLVRGHPRDVAAAAGACQ